MYFIQLNKILYGVVFTDDKTLVVINGVEKSLALNKKGERFCKITVLYVTLMHVFWICHIFLDFYWFSSHLIPNYCPIRVIF